MENAPFKSSESLDGFREVRLGSEEVMMPLSPWTLALGLCAKGNVCL